jgi:hypothetical protein
MSTVFEPPPRRHRCNPPRYRPRAEWTKVPPPLGFMKPEDRAKAKPVPVPTQYRPGTVWRCACGRLWHAVLGPPRGRGGGAGYHGGPRSVLWRRVRWYHRQLRRQVAVCDTRAAYEAAAQVVESWEAP